MKIDRSNITVTIICVLVGYSTRAASETLPLNPMVTQQSIDKTVCIHGWTKTVRPPVAYTGSLKRRMMEDFGVPPEGESEIKLDHKIPLALGGSPDSPDNFMLQPDDESRDKDRVEVCLARMVCAGKISLDEARIAIWDNWRTAGRLCSGYHVIFP